MGLNYTENNVLSNTEVSKDIYKLHVKGSFAVKPGQFFMLRGWDEGPLLQRPISVHDKDEDGIYFLYSVLGKGTKLLKNLKAGDKIELLGSLGNGFDAENIKGRAAIVAGGIGIAPMLYLTKQLTDCTVDLFAGFRDEVFSIGSFRDYVSSINISTESGKKGYKGYITDIFNAEKYDVVLCCGPEVMMNKVVKMCRERKVLVYVSMEKHMACGVGACLVCTCKTAHGNKRTCKDGPVFLGEEIVLDA